MAGYSKIYCIGGLGGFMGADGINPIRLQIWVGDSDRQWLEAHYFEKQLSPIGNIKVIIPEGPCSANALLDACLAFYPDHFKDCASLQTVRKMLAGSDTLDFHLGKDKIPPEWYQLRKEAREAFRRLNIFKAYLERIQPKQQTARNSGCSQSGQHP